MAQADKKPELKVLLPNARSRAQVVVRRLPPALPEHILLKVLEQHMPHVDFFYYATGDPSLEKNCFSRCYMNFKTYEAMVKFSQEFDGHRFRNAQGAPTTCVCAR